MSGVIRKAVPLVLLLSSALASAQSITIGTTTFPLGEVAFPSASECLAQNGCGSEDYRLIDSTVPLLRPVAAITALLGHRLDFVAIDLDLLDEIRLIFPVPIVNRNGADVYIGQAEFLADLSDPGGVNDVQIRFGRSLDWYTSAQSQFAQETGVFGMVFYQDPEIKSDAYLLWATKLDLTDFGYAAGETVSELTIRGVVNSGGSGLDAAIVGNLNGQASGNAPPQALDDVASTSEDVPVDVDILANDSDANGDVLSVATVTQGMHGTVTNNGTYVTYVPSSNFNGIDSFTYRASDGAASSDIATVVVNIDAINDAPVADAGPDQTVFVARGVVLDGSGSTDVEGDPLSYAWRLIDKPIDSAALLSDPAAIGPTFVVDVPGTYVAELVVSDGLAESIPDTITVSTTNSAPISGAGPDQTVFVGDLVTLDGSGSSDVDGDPLTFSWTLSNVPAGSAADLSDPGIANPTFAVDKSGNYIAVLIVDDGSAESAPDMVVISTENSAPVANAGPDRTVFVGSTVKLDGSASSDVDGDVLTYTWSLTSVPSGSASELSNPALIDPSFTADLPGTYVAQLIVNDGVANGIDTVMISTMNSAPTADAGPNQTVFVGGTVILDGRGSTDADGDPLTYAWSLTTVPSGSAAVLFDATSVQPTFDVDQPGIYVAQLLVHDGSLSSTPDTVTISTENSPPVANAGSDQTVLVGDTVILDGSGSSDVDGDALGYFWSLVSVPAESASELTDATAVNPEFVVDGPGSYVAQLIVSDGVAESAPDSIVVTTSNSPPIADAGMDQSVFVGESVMLDGSGSGDVDGDVLAYTWSLSVPDGSLATLSDETSSNPTFVVDIPGTYVAQLVVNDGNVDSSPDGVAVSTLNSTPTASAGADQTVLVGETVVLDGGDSSDADGDPLTYRWSLILTPNGSLTQIFDAVASVAAFVADLPGTYVAQLIVNDGSVDSPPDTASILVKDGGSPPPNPALDFELTLNEVEWHSNSSTLEVKGKTAPGAAVQVFAKGSGQLLGATVADESDRWRIAVTLWGSVPCSVRAESDGRFAEGDVAGAPGECLFKIKETEWRAADGELEVKGSGPPGAEVIVDTVESGEYLGTVVVDAGGSWRLKVQILGPVPCHVHAESVGWSAEVAIKGAPGDCGDVARAGTADGSGQTLIGEPVAVSADDSTGN